MRVLWLLGLSAVTACAAILHGGRESGPTLEVTNDGPSYVRLTSVYGVGVEGDTIGLPLGTVFANHTECFHLEARSSPQVLLIHSLDGTFTTPSFVAVSHDSWELTLTGHPVTDRLSLQPARSRCK